jgi:hypothetical protein
VEKRGWDGARSTEETTHYKKNPSTTTHTWQPLKQPLQNFLIDTDIWVAVHIVAPHTARNMWREKTKSPAH